MTQGPHMETINGYKLIKEFTNENAGFCRWAYAKKDGHVYFIKQFMSPKFPLDNAKLSEKAKSARLKVCEDFVARKQRLYSAMRQIRTGNIVVVEEFFREGSSFYITTDFVPKEDNLDISQISKMPGDKKILLIRTILYSIMKMHEQNIVHADIKPTNILIKKTSAGYYTGKIIDFDASYFEDDIPEEILGDQVYLAPEARLRMEDGTTELTCKVDIFALGILFHQYWRGELPQIDSNYGSVFEAVLDDGRVVLDESIPTKISSIISKMLSKNSADRPSAKDLLSSFADLEAGCQTASAAQKGFYIPKGIG